MEDGKVVEGNHNEHHADVVGHASAGAAVKWEDAADRRVRRMWWTEVCG